MREIDKNVGKDFVTVFVCHKCVLPFFIQCLYIHEEKGMWIIDCRICDTVFTKCVTFLLFLKAGCQSDVLLEETEV